MLNVVAHQDQALQPHDLAAAWNLDPLLLLTLVVAVAAYARGWRPADGRPRGRAFGVAVAAAAVALVSPLDALSGVLVSAHMVQHVLLIVVVAPLLAWSAPGAALLRGLPGPVRSASRRLRTGLGLDAERIHRTRSPLARGLAYVAVLWLWHASVLYGAAVEHDAIHILEHTTFVATAWLVWSAILGPARVRMEPGLAVLAVFALALQTVFLSALLTFATTPWYEAYIDVAPAWGVDALQDQQLAGAVMWVPAGLVHAAIGVALLVRWLHTVDGPTASLSEP